MDAEGSISPRASSTFRTPLLPFRPRKFSSPFIAAPTLDLGDVSGDLTSHDERLFDSGLGSTLADYDADKSRLCPRYHNDGLCELGPDCHLVHEEKRRDIRVTSFDPTAPEFFPRYRADTSQSWSEENSIARELTNLAIRNREQTRTEETGIHFEDSLTGSDAGSAYDSLKTELCTSFSVTGSCKFNEACRFAHAGSDELRRRGNPQKVKTEPCTTFHTIGSCPYGERCNFYHRSEERNASKLKTRLCKSWNSTGRCEYGSRCDFAHGSDELSVKFKTRMCKVFVTTGRCPYGAQCTFAHSEDEKRKDISTVYKFKTEICQLWLKGNCSFGPVCHFAHGFEELHSSADTPF